MAPQVYFPALHETAAERQRQRDAVAAQQAAEEAARLAAEEAARLAAEEAERRRIEEEAAEAERHRRQAAEETAARAERRRREARARGRAGSRGGGRVTVSSRSPHERPSAEQRRAARG